MVTTCAAIPGRKNASASRISGTAVKIDAHRPSAETLRGRLRDIPGLIQAPGGRAKMVGSMWNKAHPIMLPAAGLYRRIVLRRTRVVAVVGSFGKTTTRRIIAAALADPHHRGQLYAGAALGPAEPGHVETTSSSRAGAWDGLAEARSANPPA